MIDIDEFTNAELEEMGIPTPCDCWTLQEGPYWRECPECGFYEELPEARTGLW